MGFSRALVCPVKFPMTSRQIEMISIFPIRFMVFKDPAGHLVYGSLTVKLIPIP